jgi:metal-dependent amidase/aminoacylase/carboxypeptidase family protein
VRISAGNARNVIPQTAELKAPCVPERRRAQTGGKAVRGSSPVAQITGAKIDLEYSHGYR